MIKVSVIVPIYNASKHLDECLNSLKSQTINDIEFILVDDGSTDNSKNTCEKYIDDKRFIYIYKENGGQVSAYLEGFKKSKGEYIGFVDADDYVSKDMFNKMYQKAILNNADVVICGRYDISNDNKDISKESFTIKEGNYSDKNLKTILDLTFPPFNGYHLHNSRWNKIFKREIFNKNIKYCQDKARTFEDRFIVPACIFSSKSIYLTTECLYYYRHDIETSHLKARKELYEIIKKLMLRQKEMLLENKLFEAYKNQYELAQLNYLSLFVDRNIITHGTFKDKLHYSKQIIKDKDYQQLIKTHKKEMNGKKGVLLKVCYFFKSPFLLSLFSYLGKR